MQTSLILIDNSVKQNRNVVLYKSIDSFPTQATSFHAIDTGVISYYSKDSTLVDKINFFILALLIQIN